MADKRSAIAPKIMAYLTARPGEVVNSLQIGNDLDLTTTQITPVMARFVKQGLPVTVMTPGMAWRWEGPSGQPRAGEDGPKLPLVGELLEVVGLTPDGALVLRDESSRVFMAEVLTRKRH